MASDLHSLLLNGFVFVVVVVVVGLAQAVTDPIEVSAFRSISRHWNLTSKVSWNLTEPCSGTALDASTMDDTSYDPAIKCDCTANNGNTCHITQMKVYALNVMGTIPEALANLTSLKFLKLDQNYLTGPLPAFFGNLTSMETLSLAINALSGTVPKELGNLKNLKLLSFGQNNFSGSLPDELGNLANLEQLYIDSAGLSGSIPSTFSDLKNLQTVWAHGNQFTGKIPDLICNWTNLKNLRLEGSFSQGPIPTEFSNLTLMTDLRITDLSNGSSSLSFIKNMKSLNILVLRNTMMSDSIPTDIGSYKKLEQLDLSFNNLIGEIPSSLFNMDSLTYLYLGNNLLSGSIPSTKSPILLNIDMSYNNLSGSFPSWLGETDLQINLVGNSFVIDDSSNRALPSGLMCLQKSFSCNRDNPVYSSFAINCGGSEITSSSGIVFETDKSDLGAASYHVVETRRWAVSSHGNYINNHNPQYLQNTSSQIANTSDPQLFQTVRLSPVSLRYYGLGLENGNYTVILYFSELAFPNLPIWQSVGRRIFYIYLQGNLVMKDFDIKKQAGGVSFKALSMNFTANVSQNFLAIHLYWAGKGTCCIPVQGTYGPSIAAISVTPDFVPTVCNRPSGMCSPKKKTAWIVGGTLAAVVIILAISLLVAFSLKRRKRRLLLASAAEGLSRIGAKPNTLSYADLKAATNDFNVANKLGEGGYGPVYKGTFSDGRVVAVKQLSVESHQGKDQFLAEIATVSAVQHRNLVKLHGCCLEGDKHLLVYEYLENGSLDQGLFGNKRLKLNWSSRFGICLGTAQGLAYLHEESSIKIVHRDIKASNILLDAELKPKISDFGMAKLYDDNKSHLSTRVAGTVGYLAPEYAMHGHLTEKVDVFGFGVLALEIISGRPNEDASLNQNEIYLLEWKTGSLGQRNATRCGIWWAEMLKTRGQYRDAANVYLRISDEEPSLHAAVILEQASYCYLHASPPMLRKYGFHRVLAGNQYNTCSQRQLAIRAYTSALSVYRKYAWSYICDHIHYNLGRWYAIVGTYDAAVQHMLEVLACTHQSLATQKLFFEDFLHIVQELQKLGKKFDVNRLDLPSINLSSLRISYEDHRTYASRSAARIKESTWQSLEEEMVPSISSIRTNWLESLPKSFSAKKRMESLLCVRGETIRVNITFRNPLQIPIDVKGVSLLCGFSSRSHAEESETLKLASDEDKVTPNTSAQDDGEVENATNGREHADPPFATTEVDFVLKGSDSITVELNVTPTEAGVLQIIGVKWTLSGSVVGCHMFSSAPEKKKKSKMRQNLIPWEHKLKFIVLESLPKLVGCIHRFPERAHMGELHHLILELSNVSESAVKKLRLSISNPRFLIPGSKEDMSLDFPSRLQDLVVSKGHNGTDMFMNSSKNSVFIFPKDAKIEGMKSFSWPLWFRAGMVGSICLNLSVYYEMESLSDEMRFRTLRMHYTLEVLPSLDISLQITRFPTSLQEFLVRMDITNNSHANEFLLRQVSILGDRFCLSSISSHILDSEKRGGSLNESTEDKADISHSTSVWAGQMLPAGQKTSHLFKIAEINKSAPGKAQATGSGSPHCDSEQQIYVSSSPLSEFHLQERSSKENESIKEFQNTVDFVLISQQVRDSCGVKPDGLSDSLPLSSHHICNCSVDSMCPISWLMEGPQDVIHDFAQSFCEVRFQVTIRNCSDVVAAVGIVMFNQTENVQFSDVGQVSGPDQGGWHAISLGNNGKILSDLLEENTPSRKPHSSKSIPPFVWTLSGSAKFKLEPLSSTVVPMKLCIFSPGIYDLSNYELHWDLTPCNAGDDGFISDSARKYSGQSPGHPLYLTALQSTY